MIDALLILVAAAVGLLRFAITPRLDVPTAEGCYEAFAHLFVGGLFGAWAVKREKRLWLWLAIAVSLLELVMFIAQKAQEN